MKNRFSNLILFMGDKDQFHDFLCTLESQYRIVKWNETVNSNIFKNIRVCLLPEEKHFKLETLKSIYPHMIFILLLDRNYTDRIGNEFRIDYYDIIKEDIPETALFRIIKRAFKFQSIEEKNSSLETKNKEIQKVIKKQDYMISYKNYENWNNIVSNIEIEQTQVRNELDESLIKLNKSLNLFLSKG